MNIYLTIANELNVAERQVQAAVDLLDDGATVPFIARYRKEATGGLDDTQLRFLDERLHYLRELESRKETVIKSIEEQGKLTPELLEKITVCDNKTALISDRFFSALIYISASFSGCLVGSCNNKSANACKPCSRAIWALVRRLGL